MSSAELTEWQAYLSLQHDYEQAVAGGRFASSDLAWHAVYDPPKE